MGRAEDMPEVKQDSARAWRLGRRHLSSVTFESTIFPALRVRETMHEKVVMIKCLIIPAVS